MSISMPSALMSIPFADGGSKNTIPLADAAPLASYAKGFPDVTMHPLPVDGGDGVPPAGEDFNGIFYDITNLLVWMNAGGRFKFDSTLSTAVGGYPAGVVLQSNDGLNEYVSLIDNNTHDPNTPSNIGPYWSYFGGAVVMNGHYAVDTGTVNNVVISLKPELQANVVGTPIIFKAKNTNSGACTITVGNAATVSLLRSDGLAIIAGDIVANSFYSAVCDATSHYVLLSPTPSQIVSAGGGAGTSSNLQLTTTSKAFNGPTLYIQNNSLYVEGWAEFTFMFLNPHTGSYTNPIEWTVETDFDLHELGDPPRDPAVEPGPAYDSLTIVNGIVTGTISVPVMAGYLWNELPLPNNWVNRTIHIVVTATDSSNPEQIATALVSVRLCSDSTIVSD